MSNHAANPAASPSLSLRTADWRFRADPEPDSTAAELPIRSPWIGLEPLKVHLRMLANFLDQDADGNFGPVCVCRYVSRLLFGHGFGANPAPCGSSLFCFSSTALRVTVSLQILFGKYAAKISPEPP